MVMDATDFRIYGKLMVDFIADYLQTIRDRPVLPDVKPFYLKEQLPDEAPEEGESFYQIFKDIEKHIMPGVSSLELQVLGIEVTITECVFVTLDGISKSRSERSLYPLQVASSGGESKRERERDSLPASLDLLSGAGLNL